MSRFKDEVKDRLSKLEASVDLLKRSLTSKDKEIDRLEKQNKDLMDRFMATKWEPYVNQNPDRWDNTAAQTRNVFSPVNDLENVGEILSDEELGK